MTKTQTSFAVCDVVLSFGAALALVLAVCSLPKYASDGWTSSTFEPQLHPWTSSKAPPRSIPNPSFTPGAVWTQVTLADIQQPNYSKSVRNVPESEHRKVFERYGLDYSKHADFEVDHLVPLAWGGSNDVSNLWPQPFEGQWNAHVKDALEVHGLKLIREGKLDLREAQKRIAADWIGLYRELLGDEPREARTEDSEQ